MMPPHPPASPPRPNLTVLWRYFFLTYAALLVNASVYLRQINFTDALTTAYAALVFLSYGVIYLLPAMILALLLDGILTWRWMRESLSKFRLTPAAVVFPVAVLGFFLTQVFVFADGFIYRLYGFHINGFVLNLVFTPGGIESMGGAGSAQWTFAAIVGGFLALQVILLAVALRSRWFDRLWRATASPRLAWTAVILMAVVTLAERVTYGVCSARHIAPVLVASNAFPFYQPMTFRTLAKRWGFAVQRSPSFHMKSDPIALKYPLQPLVRVPHRNYNILWLVAESLRADALDPQVMPRTWAFAENATRFTNHYSGGNGTRMGMFSLFYGLYGNYWFDFLKEHRGPVIIDVLLQDRYQVRGHTSAAFTYPEFDKTIFAAVPPEHLHAQSGGPGWARDRANVTRMIDFLEKRDPDRPFMLFMFFESAHARYYFPPESVIRTPYLEDFNYATMKLDRDIELIRNRYLNSCHHLDSQIGRLLDHLDSQGLLDSTIVIVTGDHGEEFMEKGRWGHNSTFSQEQVRTPMVIHVPGRPPAVVSDLSSHLDIVPTLLPLLGVTNPPEDYSLGFDLFGPHRRTFTVLADWDRLVYVDARHKVVFPLTAKSMVEQDRVTTILDAAVSDAAAVEVFSQSRSRFVQIMGEFKRFAR